MIDDRPDLPGLELLCYHQTAPMLRVVDPATGGQRLFGGQKRFEQAVSGVLPRAGWVAGWAGRTYRFSLAADVKATRLPRGWAHVASSDRRCIWVPGADPGTWTEYDGVADEHGREVRLDGVHLVADTPHGLLTVDRYDRTMRLVDRDDPTAERTRWSGGDDPLTVNDSTVVWREGVTRLRVEHLDTGTTVPVVLPLWQLHRYPTGPASFSPDGRRLALTGDAIVGPVPLDLPKKERDTRKRQCSGLVIVDLVDGSAELVHGYFEDFAYTPVWSADGAWIFLGVPSEGAMYAVAVDAPERRLRRVEGLGRSAAMPMIDLGHARADVARPAG